MNRKTTSKQNRLLGTQPQDKQLAQFRHNSLLPGNAANALAKIRGNASVEVYLGALAWMRQNKFVFRSIFDPEFPALASQIKTKFFLAPIGLTGELAWARAYITPHLGRLASFIVLAEELEKAFMSGQMERASTLLDTVEADFGVSFWLIDKKIRQAQTVGGLEANKKYSQSIKDVADNNHILGFVTHYLSMRNEPTVSPSQVRREFERSLSDIERDHDFVEYLRYKTLLPTQWTPETIAGILRHESGGSIVDYYECLVVAIQMVIAYNYNELLPGIRSILSKFVPIVKDRRLTSMLLMLGMDLDTDKLEACLSQDALVAHHALLNGQNDIAFTKASEGLLNDPTNIDLLEIAAQASTDADINAYNDATDVIPAHQIVMSLRAVFLKPEGYLEHIHKLNRMVLQNPYHPLSNGISALLLRETTPNPLGDEDELVFFAAVTQPYIHPLRLLGIHCLNIRVRYLRAMELTGLQSFTNLFQRINENYMPQLVQKTVDQYCNLMLFDALFALLSGNTGRAKALALKLVLSTNAYYKTKGTQVLAQCLLTEENTDSLIRLIVAECLNNEQYEVVLPIEQAGEFLQHDISADDTLQGTLELAIFYNLYAKYVSSKFEMEERFALEDFLNAHNIAKPSLIAPVVSKFETIYLGYFLKFVCTERLMSGCPVFQGSKELTEERMAILNILGDFDKANSSGYEAEAAELAKRIVMEDKMRRFDQGKIYVDITGIKQLITQNLEEQFDRMKALSGVSDEDAEEVSHALSDVVKGEPEKLMGLTWPENEFNSLFLQLVTDMRDFYVSSTEHGLTGYLSVNIRHHVLDGELRKPLLNSHLVTPRNNADGQYLENQYWLDSMGVLSQNERDKYNKCFMDFSDEFDSYLTEILDTWVCVRTDTSAPGLFDFVLYEFQLRLLLSSLSSTNSFEEFCDLVLDTFNQILINACKAARNRFLEEAKPKFLGMLTRLQQNIEGYSPNIDVDELLDVISSTRTAMLNNIDKVANWFQLQMSSGSEPFSIEDVLMQSAEHISSARSDFSIKLEATGEAYKRERSGKEFFTFFLVFGIVLNNIVEHAGSIEPVARVCIHYEEQCTKIEIRNAVAPEKRTDADKLCVDDIRAAIVEQAHLASINREGGTGLHKAWKLLAYDFAVDASLEFYFDGSDFVVNFTLPTELSAQGEQTIETSIS